MAAAVPADRPPDVPEDVPAPAAKEQDFLALRLQKRFDKVSSFWQESLRNLCSCGGLWREASDAVSMSEAIANDKKKVSQLTLESFITSGLRISKLFLLAITVISLGSQAISMALGKLNQNFFMYNCIMAGLALPMLFFYLKESGERIKKVVEEKRRLEKQEYSNEYQSTIYLDVAKRNKKALTIEVTIFVYKFLTLSTFFIAAGLGMGKVATAVQVGKIAIGGGLSYFLGTVLLRCYADGVQRNGQRAVTENKKNLGIETPLPPELGPPPEGGDEGDK